MIPLVNVLDVKENVGVTPITLYDQRSVVLPFHSIVDLPCPSDCGLGRRVFDRNIRPWLTVIPIGKEGVAFDRLDLDAWIEQHKSCSGRPPEKGEPWDAQERRESVPARVGTRW